MTSNYEPLNVIGKGSFGMIRKVRRVSDGKILARKEIDYRRMSEKEKRQLVSEVNILRELKHPNIVRYYERVVDKEQCRIYIVMEYCSGGDLGSLIEKCRKEGKIIPEPTIWSFLAQLSLALLECHHTHSSKSPTGSSILHRDIKPDNVLLDDKNNIKLGDFGLSTVVSNPIEEMRKTWVGTPFYMSPELINESTYNTKSDIWALGCLIYELCALHPPFQADSHPGLAMKIRQGRVPPLPNHYSAELGRVVRTMLCGVPDKRPTAADLCKHEKIKVIIKERETQML
ncbi:kinase-like domain-containing protein [Paraphysoderma sedebokerense]|nr:kinase-like domain-containing protein [Paraphysoderma sedebokerense]